MGKLCILLYKLPTATKKWLYWSVLFSAKIRPLYIPYGYFSAMKKKSEILAVSIHPL